MSTLRTMWIKICGITTVDAVMAAAAAEVDAIGFVFAPSPPLIAAQRFAAEFAKAAPTSTWPCTPVRVVAKV